VKEDDVARLRAEVDALRAANAGLLAEVAALHTLSAELRAEVESARAVIAALEARLAAPQAPPRDLPSFVKPNKPPRTAPRPPRRKRAPAQNHGRRRLPPTQVRHQALDHCPHCQTRLYGASIARTRQVLDLPDPRPVEVIEYRLLKRYCPSCEQWREPRANFDGLVLGRSHYGSRILALVAWLRTCLRLPLRQIQTYLQQIHGLQLSLGAISRMLQRVAAQGERAAEEIKAQLRQSPVLYMDETSWRQDGQNGYVWVMTNAAGAAYFEYHKSRAGAVARALSGAHYAGTLCSDFYAAYNEHACRHQRCWAHLLRDLKKLEEEAGPQQPEVGAWVGDVVRLYRRGVAMDERAPPGSAQQREALAAQLRGAAHELGRKWAREPGHAAHALCQRLLRHEGELFEFVRQAEVEATNNRAERAIRPLAVARKISGGSRSARGSTAGMRLQTLFSTWVGRGLNPVAECEHMLGVQTPLP
jgi:transposase